MGPHYAVYLANHPKDFALKRLDYTGANVVFKHAPAYIHIYWRCGAAHKTRG